MFYIILTSVNVSNELLWRATGHLFYRSVNRSEIKRHNVKMKVDLRYSSLHFWNRFIFNENHNPVKRYHKMHLHRQGRHKTSFNCVKFIWKKIKTSWFIPNKQISNVLYCKGMLQAEMSFWVCIIIIPDKALVWIKFKFLKHVSGRYDLLWKDA